MFGNPLFSKLMQILLLLLFVLVMTLDIMKRYFLPSVSGLMPDMLAGIALLLVLRWFWKRSRRAAGVDEES